jgi:SagB-type dehydrogenase family enzyme
VTGLAPFESSIAEHYHEETKYSEEGLRRDALRFDPPDPARRTSPFKQFDGLRVLLPTDGLPLQRRGERTAASDHAPPGRLDLAKLARMLWLTNGCTRMEEQKWGTQIYRAAPSAGGMYPTEVYVAVRGLAGLAAGIYDYQILDHSLALVHAADPMVQLHGASFGHPAVGAAEAVVVLTGEWYRSSWRYRERGYRRALLDTGHVLGNLVEVAGGEGFEAVPVASFRDEVVEKMLGVDAATEGPLVLVPLVDAARAADLQRVPQRRSPVTEWHKAMKDVGDRVDADAPERIIAALQLAGRLAQTAEAVPPAEPANADPQDAVVVDASSPPTSWSGGSSIQSTIATRRSTRNFRRQAVPKAALLRALAHAYPHPATHLVAPELLETYLVAVDVDGVVPGTYRYETSPRRLIERSRGEYGEALHHMGLAQDIFADAAAALIHAVDITRAVARYGDRAYRLVHLDAGHVGERLNLALLREGLGVSGCGGYFDDEMNRVLKIPESRAVVYITAIGTPAAGE